eukprot:gene11490-34206_t
MAELIDGLKRPQLIAFIKTASKNNIRGAEGSWEEYRVVHNPGSVMLSVLALSKTHLLRPMPHTIHNPGSVMQDPARHTDKLLAGFVQSLHTFVNAAPPCSTAGSDNEEGDEGEADTPAAIVTKTKRFLRRFSNWLKTAAQEEAMVQQFDLSINSCATKLIMCPTTTTIITTHVPHVSSLGCTNMKSCLFTVQEEAMEEEMVKLFDQSINSCATKLKASPDAKASYDEMVRLLVRNTMMHGNYKKYYNLPSYTEGWIRTKRPPLDMKSKFRLLAVDTESCGTDMEENAITAICVVDVEGTTVYKALIKPKGKILDYRTYVTGLQEKDFEGITLTRGEARKIVKKLVSEVPNTILVGHALYHDLIAMRLDFTPVIDTSLIFEYKDLPACTPGLSGLVKALLGAEMRQSADGFHDAEEDALMTMRLVVYELERGRPSPKVPPPEIPVAKELLCKLLVHSIPQGWTEEDVRKLFSAAPGSSESWPELVCIEGDVSAKKVFLVFKDAAGANTECKLFGMQQEPTRSASPSGCSRSQHGVQALRDAAGANTAFKLFRGEGDLDSLGRQCKEMALPASACPTEPETRNHRIRIRKMACHNGLAFGKVTPRQAELQKKKHEQRFGKKVHASKTIGKGKGAQSKGGKGQKGGPKVVAGGVKKVKKAKKAGDGKKPTPANSTKADGGTAPAVLSPIPKTRAPLFSAKVGDNSKALKGNQPASVTPGAPSPSPMGQNTGAVSTDNKPAMGETTAPTTTNGAAAVTPKAKKNKNKRKKKQAQGATISVAATNGTGSGTPSIPLPATTLPQQVPAPATNTPASTKGGGKRQKAANKGVATPPVAAALPASTLPQQVPAPAANTPASTGGGGKRQKVAPMGVAPTPVAAAPGGGQASPGTTGEKKKKKKYVAGPCKEVKKERRRMKQAMKAAGKV